MLVLSRRCGEEIIIGDSVRLRILEIRGTCVKLGLTAPDDVRIQRLEIYRRETVEQHDAPSLAAV